MVILRYLTCRNIAENLQLQERTRQRLHFSHKRRLVQGTSEILFKMVIKEFQLALIVNILLIFIEKNSC